MCVLYRCYFDLECLNLNLECRMPIWTLEMTHLPLRVRWTRTCPLSCMLSVQKTRASDLDYFSTANGNGNGDSGIKSSVGGTSWDLTLFPPSSTESLIDFLFPSFHPSIPYTYTHLSIIIPPFMPACVRNTNVYWDSCQTPDRHPCILIQRSHRRRCGQTLSLREGIHRKGKRRLCYLEECRSGGEELVDR